MLEELDNEPTLEKVSLKNTVTETHVLAWSHRANVQLVQRKQLYHNSPTETSEGET